MIEQLDVDGIPAVIGSTTGPAHAGLAFRVGSADEPLARRGITHLIEHLTLHGAGVADYHQHLRDGAEHTIFYTSGTATEIADFLNGVCAALRDLQLGRLALEKQVLRAEANGSGNAYNAAMPMWRYGARDYGTSSFPEWGLPALTAGDLLEWAGRYFTKENATLWVAGDGVPKSLNLMLPAGSRMPPPEPSPATALMPAWFAGSGDGVVWDAELPRSAASTAFADVLERTMFRALRQEAGLSYAVKTDYRPFAGDRAMVTAMADALPEKREQVLAGFVAVLAAMRDGEVNAADVAVIADRRAAAYEQAELRGGRLPSQALNLLMGRPLQTLEEAVANARAVTRDDVAAAAAQAWSAGLLMTPDDTELADEAFTPAPAQSADVVEGAEFASLDDPPGRLVVGADGVSLVAEEKTSTVRFAGCAILRTWPDGARQLIGYDGFVVHIEPTLYAVGAARATRRIDELVAAGVRVDLPARDPRRIPQPKSAEPQPKVTLLTRLRHLFRRTRP